jgi:TatD DNase family protein
VKENFLFSVGVSIHTDSMPLIPIDSIFCETDESKMNIRDVYLQAAGAIGIDIEKFAEKIAGNVKRVFPMFKNIFKAASLNTYNKKYTSCVP